MWFSKLILRILGWKVTVTVPDYPKCIICVAPHTSNLDFIFGKLAYMSVGRQAGFLMKESWFKWPLGYFFRSIGGVPVARKNKKFSLVDVLVEKFKNTDKLAIAITPEGTRSRTSKWHTGFLEISRQAGVPICLGASDFTKIPMILELILNRLQLRTRKVALRRLILIPSRLRTKSNTKIQFR